MLQEGPFHRFVSRQTALQVLHMDHILAPSIDLSLPRLRRMSVSGFHLETVCHRTAYRLFSVLCCFCLRHII